ncbi:protein Frey 1 [Saimiri boliviensis]|uniref:protein Frey 1 n=1 Tax=Saimiri boliviensis TaxID=27679 RepID=UPI000533E6A8
MVLAMLGALHPRAGLSLFLLHLLLAAALLRSQPLRYLLGQKGGAPGAGQQRGCPSLPGVGLALLPWMWEGLPSTPTLGHLPIHKEVPVAFRARAEHPHISHRSQRSAPEAFSAPLELSQPFSGLVDDYGVRPKHPWPRGPRPLLSRAQQRKRDGPDMAEYYDDAHL